MRISVRLGILILGVVVLCASVEPAAGAKRNNNRYRDDIRDIDRRIKDLKADIRDYEKQRDEAEKLAPEARQELQRTREVYEAARAALRDAARDRTAAGVEVQAVRSRLTEQYTASGPIKTNREILSELKSELQAVRLSILAPHRADERSQLNRVREARDKAERQLEQLDSAEEVDAGARVKAATDLLEAERRVVAVERQILTTDPIYVQLAENIAQTNAELARLAAEVEQQVTGDWAYRNAYTSLQSAQSQYNTTREQMQAAFEPYQQANARFRQLEGAYRNAVRRIGDVERRIDNLEDRKKDLQRRAREDE